MLLPPKASIVIALSISIKSVTQLPCNLPSSSSFLAGICEEEDDPDPVNRDTQKLIKHTASCGRWSFASKRAMSEGGLCRWCTGFLFTLGLTALFLWLSLRPSKPTISIEEFYVPALNRSANSNFTASPPLNTTITFRLLLKNQNKESGIFYDDVNLAFFSGPPAFSDAVGSNITIDAFYQGHRKKASRWKSVEVDQRRVWDQLLEQVSNGTRAKFKVKLDTRVRYKILASTTKRRGLRLQGELEIDEQGKKAGRKGVKLHSGSHHRSSPGQASTGIVVLLSVIWIACEIGKRD